MVTLLTAVQFYLTEKVTYKVEYFYHAVCSGKGTITNKIDGLYEITPSIEERIGGCPIILKRGNEIEHAK